MDNNKPKLTELLPAKVGAFILAVLVFSMMLVFALSLCLGFAMDAYRVSRNEVKENIINDFARSMMDDVLYRYALNGAEDAESIVEGTNLSFAIYDAEGNLLCGEEQIETEYYCDQMTGFPEPTDYGYYDYSDANLPAVVGTYTVKTFVDRSLSFDDQFRLVGRVVDTVYDLRYWGFALALVSLIAFIVLFIFLMCSAGHRRGREGIWAGPMTKIPFDLLTAAIIAIVIFVFYAAVDGIYLGNDFVQAGAVALGTLVCIPVVIGWFIDLAARVKLGKWWRNTLIYIILNFIWRIFKAIFGAIGYGIKNISLVWKTVLFVVIIGILFLVVVLGEEMGFRLMMYIIIGLIVTAVLLYVSISLRKLEAGGKKIAGGDVDFRIDTSKMHGDFKAHGEALNSIGSGMTRAVDERMKSERLKTELITNVSHDIKTPLTSIINYTDLISKEQCDNEKITEYTAVLARQSDRLKKLIEDLVEASKASTGNIEVHFAPCDVGVMLEQTAAEYEEKIKASGLELVVTKPEKPVKISADGRLLWRVFDNLMNNICKYTQPDTRVYVGLEKQSGEAVITFKNISRYPLNISADELMERFVRGDSSRHTEGSGLGLNIAKSLTDLQNGSLRLDIDGDLFKVTVRFGVVE